MSDHFQFYQLIEKPASMLSEKKDSFGIIKQKSSTDSETDERKNSFIQ